jgi:hypothetical protein
MARITGISLVVAAALGLAACGSASDTKTTTAAARPAAAVEAEAVARDYAAAFVDGDYARVCALLTPEAHRRFVDAAAATGAASCAAVLEEAAGAVPADEQGGTTDVAARVLSLTGDRARVRTTIEGRAETVALVRSAGRWRVDASL